MSAVSSVVAKTSKLHIPQYMHTSSLIKLGMLCGGTSARTTGLLDKILQMRKLESRMARM